jgi:amino acid adenylation domain-containing protein
LRVETLLERSAGRVPSKTALVAAGRRVTYGELWDSVRRSAVGLRALGVRRGDRVVIQLENSIESIVAVFATLQAGAVFVVVNPTMKAEKLGFILADCGATALIAEARNRDVAARAVNACPQAVATVFAGAANGAAAGDIAGTIRYFHELTAWSHSDAHGQNRGIDQDLAALIYTSGSTGIPKGVMLTHANMIAASRSILAYLGLNDGDIILNVLPLSFDYGLYQAILSVSVGATLVIERSFAYPSSVLETLVRERVTVFPIVPTIAALLLKQDLTQYDLHALRMVTSTGAALPVSHITALGATLPNIRLFSMYGLTECKRVSFLAPEDVARRQGSVGKAMDNVEVYVVDEQGMRREHGVGELVVRGSNVMQGYWNRPDETAATLRPGPLPGERVLHTGDLFRIDPDGYLYFLARTDDVIKSRGEKVSPKEVEAVLHELPGVVEAVVVGAPDAIQGQSVKAFVAADPAAGLTERDVVRHCAERLEDFMVPRIVQLVAALPKTPNGKIDRGRLQSAGAAAVPA